MTDVGAAVIARLEADEAWQAAIGDRTDWGVSLPETPYPRAVANWITRDRPDHYDGPDILFSRLQLDVYSSKSSGEASDIGEIAIGILQPEDLVEGIHFQRAVEVEGPTDGGDQTETGYVYRARTEFAFFHAEAVDDAELPGQYGPPNAWSGVEW